MISLKQFHLFFIVVSILITAYYGYFEITNPTTPGMTSVLLSGFSFLVTTGLIVYGLSMLKKFKQV
tara:strand:- start:1908 stop:2105 length:198 start_codon:yes stop_codon:yes gene_type:complete